MRPRPALFVPLLAFAVACGGGEDPPEGAATTTASGGGADLGAVVVERAGPYEHLLGDLDYPRPAPSGGSHAPPPYWLTCGVYEGAVPDELAVHSLEHGAVWIALGPDATGADRAAATVLAAGTKVFVSDVPELANPVEVVAWEHRLVPDGVDDPRVAAFIEAFVDAPTAPEPGASCTSLGQPPTPPELPTA